MPTNIATNVPTNVATNVCTVATESLRARRPASNLLNFKELRSNMDTSARSLMLELCMSGMDETVIQRCPLGRFSVSGPWPRATHVWEVLVVRFLPLLFLMAGPGVLRAQERPIDSSDWPAYQHDNRRTGATKQELKFPLKLAWTYKARYAPSPAWPPEAKNDYYHKKYDLPERVTFDHAFHVVGAGDRIYFGSSADDKVYCLDAETGQEKWAFYTEGPVRFAPTVAGDLLLFGSDDGHVYAVRARDSKLVWKRRIAPEERLIPGNNRIISAWPVRTDVMVEGGKAYACAGIFPSQGVYQVTLNVRSGEVLNNQTLKITAQGYQERVFGKLMISTGRNPAGAFVAELQANDKQPKKEASSLAKEYPYAFIRTGDVRISGGDGKIAALDATGKEIWTAKVEGKAHSLAVVGGRLFASTDAGAVHCFGEESSVEARVWDRSKGPRARVTDVDGKTASRLRDFLKGQRGYVLILGDENGAMARITAEWTECQIIVREPDEAKAMKTRKIVDQVGLSGRITVHCGDCKTLPYGDYIFNHVMAHTDQTPHDELVRVASPVNALISVPGRFLERPKLAGAGEWTHMYADAGNTACSNDTLVGDQEQRLQWWGRPGPRGLIDRHHRTVPPLYKNGRLIVPGEDRVTGVDAYNGAILWERDIPNSRRVIAFRDSSYLAINDEHLYVVASDKCLALNPADGKTEKTYSLPAEIPGKYEWDYLATAEGMLIGSGAKAGSIRREQSYTNTVTITHWDFAPAVGSDFLFAHDFKSDKPAWVYRSKAGLIVNPTLAIGGGRIYFIESASEASMKSVIGQAKLPALLADGSTLVALDFKTGRELWRKAGKPFAGIQHAVFGSYSSEVLLIVGSFNKQVGKAKPSLWYDINAFEARTGDLLWSRSQDQQCPINGEHGEQERHPTIVDGKVYCEPYAYELKTGQPAEWKWPWVKSQRRGCGTLSASASCFFFRNDTSNAYGLEAGAAKPITTETRPGCWINLIPAGGLLLAPEASSGCTCNYAVQTSLALIPLAKKQPR
jgi:outer membrane protein assembly factor BamB